VSPSELRHVARAEPRRPFDEGLIAGGTLPRMSTARPRHLDYDEDLRSLEASELKLEFCRGAVRGMPSGTRAHAELAARRRGD